MQRAKNKYRGKRLDADEWVYGLPMYEVIKGDILITHMQSIEDACFYFIEPETLSQYTGIKDKNGKEIYEYDECEVSRPCICATGFIKFHQGCFIFQEYKTGNILRLCDIELNGYQIKVIGLAIDNPELLQEVSNE